MRYVKWLAYSGLAILLTLLIVITCLFTLVDPNQFKNAIIRQANQHLVAKLHINGDLHWAIYPNIGLSADNIILDNPPGFATTPLAQLQQLQVSVALRPLLKRQIQVNSILLEHAQIHLASNQDGQHNWNNILIKHATSEHNNNDHTTPSVSIPTIDINKIQLTDGEINYTQPNGIKQSLQKANVALSHINSKSSIQITANGILNLAQQQIPLALDSRIIIAEKNTSIALEQLVIANSHLTGNITSQDNNRKIEFNLSVDKVDAEHWVTLAKSITHSKSSTSTSSPSNVSATKLATAIPNFTVHGKIDVNLITWQQLAIQSLKATLNYAAGQLSLSPITASVDDGQYQGNLVYVLNNQQFHAQQKLSQFPVDKILTIIPLAGTNHNVPITGIVNLESDLQSIAGPQLLSGLAGYVSFVVTSGHLRGFAGDDIINKGLLFLQQDTPQHKSNLDTTDFATLSGRFDIQQGIARNQDLLLTASAYTIKGQGAIDLPNNQIDYHFVGQKLQGGGILSKYAIPFKIKGSLNKASPELDINALVKQQIDMQREQLGDKLKSAIKKLL